MKKDMRLSKKVRVLFLTIIVLFTISSVDAQNGNVWASVDDLTKLENSTVFSDLSKKMNIKYEQALSNSRNASLLKVYEFTCDCENSDLYIALQKVDELKGIEYGPQYEALSLPNDYNAVYNPLWSLDLISAEGAWDLTHGDSSINVAVSDRNYYIDHEELIGKVNYYYPYNTLPQNHGTAVAITVAGNTNNGVGLSSIGYDLSLNLYRMSYNEVLAASYAGAQVINLSWTSGCIFNQYFQFVINEVYDNGTFIVAAAGNGVTCGGPDALVYPSAFDNVFAVTSIGEDDNHERVIGNPNTAHQHNATVDLCAPGYDVPISEYPYYYAAGNGSSFAAPFVTGTVGLMLSVNPCLSNWEIEQILKQSADDIYALNQDYDGLLGAGRLNAEHAVSLASNGVSNTQPCGQPIVECDQNQSVWAGLCQTTFWGYTDVYAKADFEAINSGGYGVISSVWTDHNGNIVANGNNTSILTNASSAITGEYVTNTYRVTSTDEYGCEVSDDVDVTTYNVACKPNINESLTNPFETEILVCSKVGVDCYPYSDVEHLLNNFSHTRLGPCDAISDCEGYDNFITASNDLEESTLKVYPNPSNGTFNIATGGDKVIDRVEIYNNMGQMIISKFNASSFEIDLTDQSKGLYFLKVFMNDDVVTSVVSYL